MSQYDQIAISIEFTLISVIEGVTLYFLAASSAPILHDSGMMPYWPYVLAGLLFLLVFWSQAILHAASFIRWPMHVGHMFLYFVAAFTQVMIYSNLTDPTRWFFWGAVFSTVILGIYWLDLGLIRNARSFFTAVPRGSEFIAEVEKRHLYEFKFLAPSAFVFNAGVFLLLFFFPAQFIGSAYNIFWLGIIQVLVSGFALWDCVRNFNLRTKHIAELLKG